MMEKTAIDFLFLFLLLMSVAAFFCPQDYSEYLVLCSTEKDLKQLE